MGEVVLASRDSRFSVSRLSEEFGLDRRTVQKRLENVAAAGTRAGSPVYRLRDAVPALFEIGGHGENGDPSELPPEKRRAWYQSERVRIELEASLRNLIPVAEVETEMAEIVKRTVQFLQTLPDILERDAGLTPEQVKRTQDCIDRLRGQMYEAQVADELRVSA